MTKMLNAEPTEGAPEIHRNSPFEYVETAEAGLVVEACGHPVPSAGAWVSVAGTVSVRPALPKWMTPAVPVTNERTSR